MSLGRQLGIAVKKDQYVDRKCAPGRVFTSCLYLLFNTVVLI